MAENQNRPGGGSQPQQNRPGNPGNQGGTQGEPKSTMERATSAASNLADKAKETAGSVAQSAGQFASSIAEQASNVNVGETVGGGMKSLAGTLREHSPSGTLGDAASSVASSLERGGRFLEQEGLAGIGDELSTVIRRNPLPAMLVCIGIGFGLAHLLSPRS